MDPRARADQRNDEVMHVAIANRNRLVSATGALCGLVLLSAAFHTGLALAASADRGAAALVMEVSGTTKPPLVVHREVAPGAQISLAPGGRLALLHYSTCSIVTFSGGVVKVTDQGLEAKQANIESAKPGPCPRVHKIALGGPAPLGGGIVSRAVGGARTTPVSGEVDVEVATDGVVVLRGTQAKSALSVDLLDANRNPALSGIRIEHQAFGLGGTLPARRPYFMRIHFAGRSEPVEVPIALLPPNAKGLVILRFE